MTAKAGRNDPCPCGSGKKYKKCCLVTDEAATPDKVVPKDARMSLQPDHQHGPSCRHHHGGHGHGHEEKIDEGREESPRQA